MTVHGTPGRSIANAIAFAARLPLKFKRKRKAPLSAKDQERVNAFREKHGIDFKGLKGVRLRGARAATGPRKISLATTAFEKREL